MNIKHDFNYCGTYDCKCKRCNISFIRLKEQTLEIIKASPDEFLFFKYEIVSHVINKFNPCLSDEELAIKNILE